MTDERVSESPEERLERLIEEEKVIKSVLKQAKLKFEELRLEQKELQCLQTELMERCQRESGDKKIVQVDNEVSDVLGLKLECANQVIREDRPLHAQDNVLEFDDIVKSRIPIETIEDSLDEMISEFGPDSN